ncbi:MAG: phosphate regulon sensor histidine kinase PhoR [Candidatus Nitricoxidivorans perseverans]|uniref:Phosphate regulon sensor protein PhoR n=1 Tax=Candidatus Nitricoxidivorans perseverans TaxID=2975601 RepID=A0AA49IXC4_9PROT|nr:MAG: phosphate regulon sensor histidine kinase PhoR [Candidatus Nitricoxidivorans perseverans]
MTETWVAVAVVALLLALRHRWRLTLLKRWADAPVGTSVPEAGGAWGDAFAALHRRARLAAEQHRQLQAALDRFRQAAHALPDGVAILNPQGLIEWLNGPAEAHLGLEGARDAGAPILNLVREPEFAAYLQGCDGRAGGAPLLLRSQRNPGHTLQLQAVPFGEGRTLLMIRDVTQIEKLETMRHDFVANVSHELKTPLTVVAGFIETLADALREIPPEEAEHYLALAREQTTRMQRLIEDLLTLAALETDAPPVEERVDMAALLAEVRDEAGVLSGGRHDIILENNGPEALLGNAQELRSALSNLVSNAVRYTPEGGRIGVSWKGLPDGGAAFSVADTGIGIEARHLPRLTERFYRVDRGRSRETGGTGLGLAIVKHVLERHGARLKIESKPSEGSRFTAEFPPRRVAVKLAE